MIEDVETSHGIYHFTLRGHSSSDWFFDIQIMATNRKATTTLNQIQSGNPNGCARWENTSKFALTGFVRQMEYISFDGGKTVKYLRRMYEG